MAECGDVTAQPVSHKSMGDYFASRREKEQLIDSHSAVAVPEKEAEAS
jgi:hypothetical protein